MAQGFKNKGSSRPVKKSKGSLIRKAQANRGKMNKGSVVKLPKKHFVLEAKDDRALSKEIAKASESKVAAKLLQNGSKLAMTDLMSKGKQINREKRRNELKKKVSKVDQKINRLEMKMNK